ncbi:hypothetical protein Pla52n_56930 [Stieleria varia]|uniref:Uncharacterized protein n=1 Tax=Stieleria varia TaxID=2528005 RepID=A0A5C6A3C3_9BACT|nr:hypothetical protein Pla52n_56930 [Stieleria varia]
MSQSRSTIVARLSKSIACPGKRLAIAKWFLAQTGPPPSHSPQGLCSTSPKFLGGGDAVSRGSKRMVVFVFDLESRTTIVG